MAVPGTQKSISSQRKRKGTIASRYLEAIGIQCGAETNVNNTNQPYRSTPIDKRDSGFDRHYYSFKDSPSMSKNKNKAIWSHSVYDKISNTTKAADCSKSIITASTALMLDHSDSISTTPTSPGGSGHSKGKSPSRGRLRRRGRSPTAIREGTNSKSRTENCDDSHQDYFHLPGSRSTAPLSDGVKSAPSTPSRLSEHRKLQFRARSWGNRTTNSAHSSGSPIAPPSNTKSIMGLNSSTSESSGDYSSEPDSRLGLTFYKNTNNDAAQSPLYNPSPPAYNEPSPVPSHSSHDRRRGLFPKTSPRRPSGSPGPQPRSPRQYKSYQRHEQEQRYSGSLSEQTPKTPDHKHQEDHSSHNNNGNNLHPHYPTESEAGSPTEIMENRCRPSIGADETSQPSSLHYHSDPTDSEAGAPTEITKNHTILRKPYHLRRPSSGNGGNQIITKDRPTNSTNDILSRVRNRFHNQQQQPQPQPNNPDKVSMPSLLDSSSSCASSALPIAAAQAEGASASILSPAPHSSTRLSRHVENARKQSILSPDPSEATSQPASIDNETFGSTSLTTNIGLPLGNNRATHSGLAKTPAKETLPKQGGLLRRPVGARVAALESQYRRGKLTVRGARPESVEKQQIMDNEEHTEDEKFPDPILSPSYSLDDNIQYQYKQDEAKKDELEENIEFKNSEEDSVPKSNDSPYRGVYDDDYEESPMPEYIRNQATGKFIPYNDRQTPNTDGVFQFKSNDKRKIEKRKAKKASAARDAVTNSRGRDREGKSPIQPLFSSERLDESNTSSIIRSKSLGRSKTSNQLEKITNKRSKSLSERSERKKHQDQQQVFSRELSQAMKTIAKERKRRNQLKQKQQESSKQSVPGNIVVNKEKSNILEGAERSISGSSITQSSVPSPPSQPSRTLGANRFLPSPGEATAKAPRNQGIPRNEPTTSIKEKIRAFNLKKSPKKFTSSPRQSEPSRDRTSTSGIAAEEKKEDGSSVERFNENRNNLERKSRWARYYVESLNNRDEDESNSSANDDFSVHSLREQLEQKISKSQNDISGGDEEDDDDRSVKSLRDMFEPSSKKQTGEAVNNLKARFEPKPKAPRMSFTKQARLQRQRSKRIEESSRKVEGYGEPHPNGLVRSNLESVEAEEEEKNETGQNTEDTRRHFEWWELEQKNSPEVNDRHHFKKKVQGSNDPFGRLNDWSKGYQAEKTPTRRHTQERNRISNDSNIKSGETLSRDGEIQQTHTNVNTGNRYSPSKNQVFGEIEKRQAPLKDNNRKVPGYQWVMKGDSSDGENQVLKKGITESSSGSSDAVTLDPSFAEVSNLSNPSALQSLDTEQEDLGDSSSVLFANLDSNLISDEVGTSNSDLAIPELKESRRQAPNTRVVSGSSLRKYRNLNTQKKINVEEGIGHTDINQEYSHIVTPDSGSMSGSRAHFFNKVDHEDPNDRGYSTAVNQNNVHGGSRGIVSPIHGNPRHPAYAPSPGLKALNVPSRPMPSSDDVVESNSQNERTKNSSYQNSEPVYSSMENSHRCFDSSNRSSRSTDTPPSYRSNRSSDLSDRSRRLQESPRVQSFSVPRREGEFSDRSTRSSGLSSFQDNSSLSLNQTAKAFGSLVPEDHGPSWDERRDQDTVQKQNMPVGTSQSSSNQPAVPTIPSPFDEDYAAIMESRHKMLVVRQRALLSRRANREKAQKYQQGFFGRTNPENTDESISLLLNRTYREPRLSDEVKQDMETQYQEIRRTGRPSNPSSGWETPPTPHGADRRKDANEAGLQKSPVASMLSRIRPTFSTMPRRDNGPSQKQAVIDRISAVRAARLRRNYAYGKVVQSSNNYGAASESNRQESDLPRKLETINNSIPGYRYYPHNDSLDFRTRDEDESLSTFESNPQEFAAVFSLD